jgi:hypothetical protein
MEATSSFKQPGNYVRVLSTEPQCMAEVLEAPDSQGFLVCRSGDKQLTVCTAPHRTALHSTALHRTALLSAVSRVSLGRVDGNHVLNLEMLC